MTTVRGIPRQTILLTLCVVSAIGLAGAGGSRPPDDEARARPLYATLWMQTSGEYALVCRQVYALATAKVLENKGAAQTTSAGKPPAVVMDLDETVLDNSKFQALLYDTGMKSDLKTFLEWAGTHPGAIELVPGARQFIEDVRKRGVHVVFVSNRPPSVRAGTVETLRRLGITSSGLDEPIDLGLLLSEDGGTDKRPRFRRVAEKYEILAFVGDNLGDFPEQVNPAAGEPLFHRRGLVEKIAGDFGKRCFILPNPVYGDWTRGLGDDPSVHLLRPTQ